MFINILSIIPVLTRAELSSRPATVLLSFSASLEPDSLSLSGFAGPILRLPAMQQRKGALPRTEANERLAKLAGSEFGTLYI